MIESGIRGGIATISHRHAIANNEYMGAEFDPTKDSKFNSYLDANNLYGWVMSKNFQHRDLNGWLTMNLTIGNIGVVSLKLTYNFRKIYTTFTMIILLLRNALKLKM